MAALCEERGLRVQSVAFGKENGAPLVRATVSVAPGVDSGGLLARLAHRTDIESLTDEPEE